MNQYQQFMQQVMPVPHSSDGINYEECKKCAASGPVCCQRLPCSLSPGEIKDLSFQGICNLIETGLVSIDWWMGKIVDDGKLDEEVIRNAAESLGTDIPDDADEDLYYKSFFLRMRGKDDPVCHPAILPSICVAWSATDGCKFPFCYRPKGGRNLYPPHCTLNSSDTCKEGYTKKRCAYDWMPYHDILEQVYEKYKDWWTDSPHVSAMMELMKMVNGTPEQKELIDAFLS